MNRFAGSYRENVVITAAIRQIRPGGIYVRSVPSRSYVLQKIPIRLRHLAEWYG